MEDKKKDAKSNRRFSLTVRSSSKSVLGESSSSLKLKNLFGKPKKVCADRAFFLLLFASRLTSLVRKGERR